MCKFKVGDVVWALCPYSDRSGAKARPAIIFKINTDECKYLLVECYSLKEKHSTMTTGLIIYDTTIPEFAECGFEDSTYIDPKTKSWLKEYLIKDIPSKKKNPIGICTFLDKLV